MIPVAQAPPSPPPVLWRPAEARSAIPLEHKLAAGQIMVAGLQASLQELAQDLGFQGGLYVHLGHAIRHPGEAGCGAPIRFLATSAADRRLYLEEGALACDPVASRVGGAHTPFVWRTAPCPGQSEPQRQLGARLRARGIQGGVAVPVQDYAAGPAYLSFYSAYADEAEDMVQAQGPVLAFAAAGFHGRIKACLPTIGRAAEYSSLTAREIDCLRLAALGRTAPETAEALQVTTRTVEFHLKNAAEKFGASNKVRAVALAISLGLIEL